jgi:hypothetical protein
MSFLLLHLQFFQQGKHVMRQKCPFYIFSDIALLIL